MFPGLIPYARFKARLRGSWAMSVSASEFVILRSGLALPLAAVKLAIDLESRGIGLAIEGEALAVGPSDRLTDEDREAIRRWRGHLIEIVTQAECSVQ